MQSHFLRVKLTYCLSLSVASKGRQTHLGNRPLLSLSEPQTEYTQRRTEKQGQLVDRQHSSAMCGPICWSPAFLGDMRANLLIASFPRRCAGLFVNRQLSSAMWGPICIAPAFLGAKEVVARSHPSIKTEQRIMNHCIIGCVISEVGGDACGWWCWKKGAVGSARSEVSWSTWWFVSKWCWQFAEWKIMSSESSGKYLNDFFFGRCHPLNEWLWELVWRASFLSL